MRESLIEAHLVKRVKALGGEVRKVKFIGRNGAPDRLVMLPTMHFQIDRLDSPDLMTLLWPVTFWVELKATGKRAEPHQVREHERMRKMGHSVYVIDSIEGVDALLG